MDDMTGTQAYSYLRPRMQMPSPLLEHALFPNCPRFPELDRIRLPETETRRNYADASPEQFTPVVEAPAAKRPRTVRSSSDPIPVRSGLFPEKEKTASTPAGKSSSLPTKRSPETTAKTEEVVIDEENVDTDRSPGETSPMSFDATAPFDDREDPDASTTWKKVSAEPVNTQAVLITAVSMLVVSFVIVMAVLLVPNTSSHQRRFEDEGGLLSPEDAGRRRRSGADEVRGEVPASATTLPEPRATRKRSFELSGKGDSNLPGGQATPLECDTEACRWESRLVNEKLNVSVDPCVDFYAYVCSAAWDLNEDMPYRAAGKAFLVNEVTRYLREHAHSLPAAGTAGGARGEHNFLDHSSLVLNGCLKNAVAKTASQWDGIRGLLRDVGLEDWPYIEPPQQPFQLDSVLKLIDRQMAIFPIVYVFLRKLSDSGSYVIHLDAPRNILLVQYRMQKTDESLPYKEIIRQILTLWKTLPRSGAMADDVMSFEAQIFNASKPRVKPFWKKDAVYSFKDSLRLPKFRVDAYISHLRPHDADEVVVLNEAYFDSLSTILRELIPRTVLNFLGVHVIAQSAPLLPQDSIPRDLMRMGYPSFQPHVEPRTQSCFHLVSRLYPHGMRRILRDILARTSDLDRQWDLTTKNMVSSLAHTFRQGASWAQSVDVTHTIGRLKALQVGYLAGKEREEDIDQYYAPMNVTYGPDNLVRYYGKLLASSLNRYWESSSDGASYDARHEQRSTDLDVLWTRSPESTLGIYLTSSSVASAALVTRANYPPTLFPLLAADVTRALFLSSLDGPQWSSWNQDRFRELQYCLLKRYERGIRTLRVSASSARYFLADILADNAVIKPLMAAFRRFSHAPLSAIGQRPSNRTAWRLFFVNYAAGFCVPGSEAAQIKERMRYRVSLPPSVRVNLALRDVKRFREVFKCPRDPPLSRCAVWKRDEEEDNDPAESGWI
ncbi:neprilysin-1-like [Amblyomma americanum]